MAIWLVRAGSHGQFEQRFISDNKIYINWDNLNIDLLSLSERSQLASVIAEREPDAKQKSITNWVSQIWPFAHVMKKGDWIVVPLKSQPVVYIGEITGNYIYDQQQDPYYLHSRTVKWIGDAIPRSNFSQDLLYSFGAFMTICRIQRNNAEQRLQAMAMNGWNNENNSGIVTKKSGNIIQQDAADDNSETNLEDLAREQILRLIDAKFKGHKLTRLVSAILSAQGYTIWQSPEGADGGADILAGSGPMGFGEQQICVEVKSGTGLVDRPTVDKLLGAMTKFNAPQGLFVAWGGFKANVQKELASSFFRLRLWSQDDLLEQLFAIYDKLDEDIRAELPLKRIWSVALIDE